MMATTTFDRVYVWERPVRLYHWATAAGMLVLIATGFLMGSPPAVLSSGDASSQFWFGTVRLLHFAAGFVATFALVVRIYWMFAGNRYATWNNFFPLTPTLLLQQLSGVLKVVKVDLLQIEVKPLEVVGHNALAAWSYAAVFVLTLFQIFTGFALYAPMATWWFPQLFAWVVPLMGGDASVRLWHHVVMWPFAIFILVHVYLTVYHDYVEGHGEISSIVSGSKFVEKHG
jgi:Ni/Fe-hydrogenase 1 B-type cytochrome subunit